MGRETRMFGAKRIFCFFSVLNGDLNKTERILFLQPGLNIKALPLPPPSEVPTTRRNKLTHHEEGGGGGWLVVKPSRVSYLTPNHIIEQYIHSGALYSSKPPKLDHSPNPNY